MLLHCFAIAYEHRNRLIRIQATALDEQRESGQCYFR